MAADGRIIETRRLSLILFNETLLSECLHATKGGNARLASFKMPDEWFQNTDFIAMRRDQCRADPSYAPWAPRAIVVRESNAMIGHIGFHEPPDPEHLHRFGPNAIEFGYTIYPAFRRQGYATEAVRGLMSWAAKGMGIKTLVVSIAPDNAPSQAIARRFGFTKVAEHVDEKDGLEEILVLRSADTFLST